MRGYRADGAKTVVVALGSVLGTIEDVVDGLRDEGVSIGALSVKCFRPFPLDEIREALVGAERVIVLEKAFAIGLGGILAQNVHNAVAGLPAEVLTTIAGLGGRPITKDSLRDHFAAAIAGETGRLTFLDLNRELVERELQRSEAQRRSGPHAENMLRDLGVVAAGPV